MLGRIGLIFCTQVTLDQHYSHAKNERGRFKNVGERCKNQISHLAILWNVANATSTKIVYSSLSEDIFEQNFAFHMCARAKLGILGYPTPTLVKCPKSGAGVGGKREIYLSISKRILPKFIK